MIFSFITTAISALQSIYEKISKSPLVILLSIVLVIGICYGCYHAGEKSVQAKWDKEKSELAISIEKTKAESKIETVKNEVKYIDRVKIVKQKGDTILTL